MSTVNKYKFGASSRERLGTCDSDLQLLAKTALACSEVDFMIVEGHRSVERQNILYKAGKSKIDGLRKKGKHNYYPSEAYDICCIVKGRAKWSEAYGSYLGGLLRGVWEMLKMQGKVSGRLRWGGNWDGDGEIITDQSFDDLPHFEIIKE